MARENQGLQIALIIFVMLTIILGVTTFIFFRQYEEADQKATDAQRDASQQRTAANTIQKDNNELKRMMGFPPSMEMDEITTKFNEDMANYAGAFPEDARYYSPVVGFLAKALQDKNAELVDLQARYDVLDAKYKEREKTMLPQIEEHRVAKQQVADDLASRAATFDSQRERITGEQAELAEKLSTSEKESEVKLTALKTEVENTKVRAGKLATQLDRAVQKIESLRKETFEEPDGEIVWVDQSTGTVWLNLGRADGLHRQVTFSVYPADITNLSKAGKKASIEVTEILGEHRAKADILEDKVSDPVMPGDKIYTPIWTVGQPRRFALAGLLDIDGDEKSDLEIVRNLITMNGGIVDCYLDENGQPRGSMSGNTRYLVLGEAPTAKGKAETIKGYSWMQGEAKRLGIQKITLGELLQRMGWKNQTPVVQFGRGANPSDFRAKPAGGVPRVSPGNVTELFQPRRPPPDKPAPRSAY